MPRTWLAGLLSKLGQGVSRTRKALKMSGGAKAATKKAAAKPAAKPAAKRAGKGVGVAVPAPTAIKVGSTVTCKGMLGTSKPFKVSKIAADTKKVQQVYDAAKPAKPAYPLAKCTVAAAAAPVVPIKAGATVVCSGMLGKSKPFVVDKVAPDAKKVRQVYDKANPKKPAYPEAKCTVAAAAAPVVPIKAGATVVCSGMLGKSKPFVVDKVAPDAKKVRQVYDKANPKKPAYPEAKCTVSDAVAAAGAVKAGDTVICKGMLGSSKPFTVAKVEADKKGVRQVYDAANPKKVAYPAAKCSVAPPKFKKGDVVQCTMPSGGRTVPLTVSDPVAFVLADAKGKTYKTYKPTTCAVASSGGIKVGSTVTCKGMLGTSKPFKVSSIKVDAKGVSQVYDAAKPAKPAYPEAKCTVAAKVAPIKAGSIVKCKGMFGTSKPFTVAKVEADKKGVRQVYDEAKPTKPAYPEAKCTVESEGASNAGTGNAGTSNAGTGEDPTGNAGTGNANTPVTDPTGVNNSATVTATPVSVGQEIPAPPPGAPPPPAGNTIALKIKASEKDLVSPEFNAVFFKATGKHIDGVYEKNVNPDGTSTMKVLNPPAGGGRTRKMRGGAKAPKGVNPAKAAKKAAKAGKALTPEQQAKKNAGIAASKTKKASGPAKQAKMTPQQKAAQKAAQKGMTPQQKMNAQKAAQAQARAAKPAKVAGPTKMNKRLAARNQTRKNMASGKGPTTITRNNSNVSGLNLNANAAYAALSAKKEPQTIIVETKDEIKPAEVEKKLEGALAGVGLKADVLPVAPPDPTPETPASDVNASTSGTFAAAGHKDGDKPFDFVSLAANPGKAVELKGKQLYTRFPTLGPGQIIHTLGDTQTGISYSEFAVDDDGLRIFRVVGTPSQIAASSKTVANRIQLEEIMTGPGGYVTLIRDLEDEEARLKGTINFYQTRIATYEASLGKMPLKERKPIQARLPGLTKSLNNNQSQLAEVQRHIMSFRAARNAAAAMGAPLSGGRRR